MSALSALIDELSMNAGPAHAPGDLIANAYRLISPLGEGGMASVWRAHSLHRNTDVAIKLLQPSAGGGMHRSAPAPEIVERLLVEARAVARVNHPSIVRILDVGARDCGEPFLVMELLRGETLADLLELRGKLPAVAAVQLMLPVAGALAAAHAEGIVHRDLKTDNILLVPLSEDGARLPKVIDFGLARLESDQRTSRLTKAGSILGSPVFMAPEQVRGELDIDARADVWAFCVVLYLLVTGRLPFEGDDIGAVFLSILHGDPRPLSEAEGGAELGAILGAGFAKEPSGRWASMKALGGALAAWVAARGATVDITGAPLDETWFRRPLTSRPPRITPSAPPVAPAAPATPAPREIAPAREEKIAAPTPLRGPSRPRWYGIALIAALLAVIVVIGLFVIPRLTRAHVVEDAITIV